MNINIDTQNDYHLATIDGWEIFRTNDKDPTHYIVGEKYIIIVLGQMHNAVLAMALTCQLKKINYDECEGVSSLSFLLPGADALIFSNAELSSSMVDLLLQNEGGITIMTPTRAHQSGRTPGAVATPHPSGRAIDVIRLSDIEELELGAKIIR